MTPEELILEAARIEMKARTHEWLFGPETTQSKLFWEFWKTGKMPEDAVEQIRKSGEECMEKWGTANAELERLMVENGIAATSQENDK